MTTQTIDAALAQLRLIVSQMAPVGEPALQGVVIYPNQYESISLEVLPVVIVNEAINLPVQIRREAQRRTLMHQWKAQVQIMLIEGALTDDVSAAAAAARHRKWVTELARVIVSNSTLNSTAIGVGVKIPGEVLTYRMGKIPWWTSRTFWGVNAVMDVYQTMAFETQA